MSVARRMAVMRNNALLRALDDDALKFLAFNSETQSLRQREVLFEEGEPADGAVLMLGGQLRLETTHLEPRVAGVGDLIDDLALIVPRERKATAVAQSTCEVLILPRDEMLRVLDEYPDGAARVQQILAERATRFFADAGALSSRLRPL